jgi:NADPH-dependent 2,4-dienoyl-CoA reductase/sulfur reductase-like enzyme
MRLLVIGGSDAGIAAALRARELDPAVEATLVVADAFPRLLHLRAAPPRAAGR